MQWQGCGTALVTPFTQDGAIDESALRNLIAWQVESGIDFLVPCGTTGETPTLSHDEWLHVIDTTVEVVAGRVPVVAGATSNSTAEGVAKAKEVAARPGVDAILTASPYYNKPTQEGQYRQRTWKDGRKHRAGHARQAGGSSTHRSRKRSEWQHRANRRGMQFGAGAFPGFLGR
jgi:dihydrodipicolinate synthase/N-acetylneuraminate lyase